VLAFWLVMWSAYGIIVRRRIGRCAYALARLLTALQVVVGRVWLPWLLQMIVLGRSLPRRIVRVLCALARSCMVVMTFGDLNRHMHCRYMDWLLVLHSGNEVIIYCLPYVSFWFLIGSASTSARN